MVNSMGSQEEKFISVLQEISDMYHRKNHDYGDSFRKSLEEFGLVAAVVRMSDKMERIKTLIKGEEAGKEALVRDEKIRDTLMDLANYAIMTVMEM